MRKAEAIAGVVLTLMGLAMLFIGIPAQTTSGDEVGLPAAMFPTVSMALVTALAALLVVTRLLRRGQDDEAPPMPPRIWRHLGFIVGLLGGGYLALDYLGYVAGGALTVAAMMVYMGARRPVTIIATAVIGPTLIYLFFWEVFRIPLP